MDFDTKLETVKVIIDEKEYEFFISDIDVEDLYPGKVMINLNLKSYTTIDRCKILIDKLRRCNVHELNKKEREFRFKNRVCYYCDGISEANINPNKRNLKCEYCDGKGNINDE